MAFIQEIIYRNKGWDIYSKSWWVWINKNLLKSSVCECWKFNVLCYLRLVIDSFGVEHIPK